MSLHYGISSLSSQNDYVQNSFIILAFWLKHPHLGYTLENTARIFQIYTQIYFFPFLH